jgi:predicted nucleic acid-binding protein
MRVVLDTNIIVSALIAPAGKPAAIIIIDAWLDGKFTLLTSAAHVVELRSTLQKPGVAELVKPHKAGGLINQVKKPPRTSPRCRAWNAPLILPMTFSWPCPKLAMPII